MINLTAEQAARVATMNAEDARSWVAYYTEQNSEARAAKRSAHKALESGASVLEAAFGAKLALHRHNVARGLVAPADDTFEFSPTGAYVRNIQADDTFEFELNPKL